MQAIVEEVLIYYDGPQLVRANTDAEEPAIAVNLDDDGKCLVAVVSPETMAGIIDDRIELRDAFTTLRIGPAYTSTIDCEGAFMALEPIDGDPPQDWLPEADCKLHP